MSFLAYDLTLIRTYQSSLNGSRTKAILKSHIIYYRSAVTCQMGPLMDTFCLILTLQSTVCFSLINNFSPSNPFIETSSLSSCPRIRQILLNTLDPFLLLTSSLLISVLQFLESFPFFHSYCFLAKRNSLATENVMTK